jgi:hypothetical protein
MQEIEASDLSIFMSPERKLPQARTLADFPVGNRYAPNDQLMAKHERRLAIHRRQEGP